MQQPAAGVHQVGRLTHRLDDAGFVVGQHGCGEDGPLAGIVCDLSFEIGKVQGPLGQGRHRSNRLARKTPPTADRCVLQIRDQ